MDQRAVLDRLFRTAVARVDPYEMIRSLVRLEAEVLLVTGDLGQEYRYLLEDFDRIVVLGAGKASAPMARAVEEILGDRISASLVVVKYGHSDTGRGPFQVIRLREAGHPIPDEAGAQAAREMVELAQSCDERTLVINLLSGGGSALLPAPLAWEGGALTLEDKQEVTHLLLASGADIQQINGVRKHLSALKGGRLAALVAPATLVNVILSDVVGDPLDSIASGPTVADPTTWTQAWATLEHFGVAHSVPQAVLGAFEAGLAGHIPETPKPGDPVFDRVTNVLGGTNFVALQAAATEARALGFRTLVLTSALTGEAKELALVFAGIARDQARRHLHGKGSLVVLAGGESTVTLKGHGKGGRNQEMALAFLAEINRWPEIPAGLTFLSAATDGNDGPTDAAGAFVDDEVVQAARKAGLSPIEALARNDSYGFFDVLGSLYRTGPTNTNVCDLQFLLVSGVTIPVVE